MYEPEAKWEYDELDCFKKDCRRIGKEEKSALLPALRKFVESFNNQYLNDRNKRIRQTSKFEVWVCSIGNPGANKGEVGGFRVTFYLKLSDRKAVMYSINRRDKLGFKGEGPRKTARNTEDNLELIKDLEKKYGKI